MRFRFALGVLSVLLLVLLAGCGSDGDSPSEVEQPPEEQAAACILRTGWWEMADDARFAQEIPSPVSGVVLSVKSSTGTAHYEQGTVSADGVFEIPIELPASGTVLLELIALDETEMDAFYGRTYLQMPVAKDTLSQNMYLPNDHLGPEFSEDLTVTPRSSRNLEVQWELATEAEGVDYQAYYVVWATPSGEAPTELPQAATGSGENSFLLTNLQQDTAYDVVVKAVDGVGNFNQTAATSTVSTLSADLRDWYVDSTHGVDAPSNGSSDHPFKTITYALTRTEGNESIIIGRGTYSTATGEVFPLILKPGTQLFGELQYDPLFPVTRLEIPNCESAIVGAGWNFLFGIQLIAENAETRSYSMIKAVESDLYMQFMVFDGNGGGSEHGVMAGGEFRIRDSIFTDFPVGRAVSLFSNGTLNHCLSGCYISDSQVGVSASNQADILGCEVTDCGLGIYCYLGNGVIVSRTIVSRSTSLGVQVEGSQDVRIMASMILHSARTGIEIFSSEAPIIICKCLIQSEDATGIAVRGCPVTLEQNTLSCNRTNLWVTGSEQVDARSNAWHEAPPLVLTDGDDASAYDSVDVIYYAEYAGTPRPLLDPFLGAGGCTVFMISPLDKSSGLGLRSSTKYSWSLSDH